jgi:hypothetical protein
MLCLCAEGEWVLSTEQPPAPPPPPPPAVEGEEVEKPPHAGPIQRWWRFLGIIIG